MEKTNIEIIMTIKNEYELLKKACDELLSHIHVRRFGNFKGKSLTLSKKYYARVIFGVRDVLIYKDVYKDILPFKVEIFNNRHRDDSECVLSFKKACEDTIVPYYDINVEKSINIPKDLLFDSTVEAKYIDEIDKHNFIKLLRIYANEKYPGEYEGQIDQYELYDSYNLTKNDGVPLDEENGLEFIFYINHSIDEDSHLFYYPSSKLCFSTSYDIHSEEERDDLSDLLNHKFKDKSLDSKWKEFFDKRGVKILSGGYPMKELPRVFHQYYVNVDYINSDKEKKKEKLLIDIRP